MIFEQIQETLADMVANGAALQIGGTVELIGRAGISQSSGVFWWCPPFPIDQHHFHFVQWSNFEMEHGRDLVLTTPDVPGGVYVAPLVEWPLLDQDEAREVLGRWRTMPPADVARFDAFVQDELSAHKEMLNV